MNHDAEPGTDAGRTEQQAAATEVESMTGVLDGDRPCLACGYNLSGQPIVREPHYGLLVVRCPECGRVAGIEESPLLGRAAGRLAAAGLALWLLFVLGFAGATALALFGTTMGSAEVILGPVQQALRLDFQTWSQANLTGQSVSGLNSTEQKAAVDQWLQQHGGVEGFVAGRGGWAMAIDPWSALIGVPLGGIAFAIGVAWSVLLLGCARPRLLAIGLALLAIAALIVLGEGMQSMSEAGAIWWYQMISQRLAVRVLIPVRLAALILIGFAFLAGTWFGRSIARGVVRLLLPPKLRTPLAFLWVADQLPPPSARGRRASVTARTPPR